MLHFLQHFLLVNNRLIERSLGSSDKLMNWGLEHKIYTMYQKTFTLLEMKEKRKGRWREKGRERWRKEERMNLNSYTHSPAQKMGMSKIYREPPSARVQTIWQAKWNRRENLQFHNDIENIQINSELLCNMYININVLCLG